MISYSKTSSRTEAIWDGENWVTAIQSTPKVLSADRIVLVDFSGLITSGFDAYYTSLPLAWENEAGVDTNGHSLAFHVTGFSSLTDLTPAILGVSGGEWEEVVIKYGNPDNIVGATEVFPPLTPVNSAALMFADCVPPSIDLDIDLAGVLTEAAVASTTTSEYLIDLDFRVTTLELGL